jgi:hypothetical protein
LKVKDHSRSSVKSHLEIVDTFQDAGTRPIEESPDHLIPKAESKNNLNHRHNSGTSKNN